MKKFKSILQIGLLSLIIISCKKGENDPALPFQTRDARIVGKWELVKLESSLLTTTSSSSSSSTYETVVAYEAGIDIDETNASQGTWQELDYVNGTAGTPDITWYEEDLIINKDGTYEREWVRDGDTTFQKGSWWWLDDHREKTRIAFDDDIDSYEIDRLARKELILKRDFVSKNAGSNGFTTEDTYTLTMTFREF